MTNTEIKESLEKEMMVTLPDYDWQLIATKIQQAIAEERARVVREIEKLWFKDLFTQQEIIDMRHSEIALLLIAAYTKQRVEDRQKIITMISSLQDINNNQ